MAIVLGLTCRSLSATVVIDAESAAPKIFMTKIMVAEELLACTHVPNITILIPVRKRGKSGKIVRSPHKRHLNTAMEPATAVMKREYVLDVTKAAKSSRLSPGAGSVQEASLQATKTMCIVYKKDFRSLYETLML